MTKLYYQFPETWFGDCMPFGKDDKFFLFHRFPPRVFCIPASAGHVRSTDCTLSHFRCSGHIHNN